MVSIVSNLTALDFKARTENLPNDENDLPIRRVTVTLNIPMQDSEKQGFLTAHTDYVYAESMDEDMMEMYTQKSVKLLLSNLMDLEDEYGPFIILQNINVPEQVLMVINDGGHENPNNKNWEPRECHTKEESITEGTGIRIPKDDEWKISKLKTPDVSDHIADSLMENRTLKTLLEK